MTSFGQTTSNLCLKTTLKVGYKTQLMSIELNYQR
jgi:hypothetical protein